MENKEIIKHALLIQHNLISQLKFSGDDLLKVAEVMKLGLDAIKIVSEENEEVINESEI